MHNESVVVVVVVKLVNNDELSSFLIDGTAHILVPKDTPTCQQISLIFTKSSVNVIE